MINLINAVERNFYGVPAMFADELLKEGKEIDFDEETGFYTVYDKCGNDLRTFENFISDNMMMELASYMDDEYREIVHFDFAPCSNEKFIEEYCKRDENFWQILREFGIEI